MQPSMSSKTVTKSTTGTIIKTVIMPNEEINRLGVELEKLKLI